ncbi:peptidoglycan recognition family protein [Geomicrobium sediminis]|uniref:Peptidoglycan recognition protein family domain-containing protein n=1 Tax=Geomicrobium sediminis TaxID=1347788 RepID=A0ABS2PEV2_9BACL|nr:peptidoglycan recognition family protein [Geomicrobium sediminis]MBM7633812.1 hypothetical protein [Geomicrobium sediminis]
MIKPTLRWGSLTPIRQVRRIIIHHPGAVRYSYLQVHNQHRNQGWSGAGYNYYLQKNHEYYELRGLNVGAHAANNNSDSLGVCVEGNYDVEHIDEELFLRFVQEVRKLIRQHGLTANDVYRHSDVGNTSCPGRNFPWARFKRLIGQSEEVKSIVHNPKEEVKYVTALGFTWGSSKELFEEVLAEHGNPNEKKAYEDGELTTSDAIGVLTKATLHKDEPSETVPEVHREFMELKVREGVTNGEKPNHSVTRAQAVTMIGRNERLNHNTRTVWTPIIKAWADKSINGDQAIQQSWVEKIEEGTMTQEELLRLQGEKVVRGLKHV